MRIRAFKDRVTIQTLQKVSDGAGGYDPTQTGWVDVLETWADVKELGLRAKLEHGHKVTDKAIMARMHYRDDLIPLGGPTSELTEKYQLVYKGKVVQLDSVIEIGDKKYLEIEGRVK